ncbi:hypothetical protein LTR17_022038 [Elasticomyces elasticus]|nr:hypothetical protein LTR17_022038 [Elasticomyces elasticus]
MDLSGYSPIYIFGTGKGDAFPSDAFEHRRLSELVEQAHGSVTLVPADAEIILSPSFDPDDIEKDLGFFGGWYRAGARRSYGSQATDAIISRLPLPGWKRQMLSDSRIFSHGYLVYQADTTFWHTTTLMGFLLPQGFRKREYLKRAFDVESLTTAQMRHLLAHHEISAPRVVPVSRPDTVNWFRANIREMKRLPRSLREEREADIAEMQAEYGAVQGASGSVAARETSEADDSGAAESDGGDVEEDEFID